MDVSTVIAFMIPLYAVGKSSVLPLPICITKVGWKMSAAKAPSNVPTNKAMRGDVFFTIKTMTIMGTTNSHGLILMDFPSASKTTCVSVTPFVSRFKPKTIKTINVIMMVGVVVYIMYRMCVNKSVPAMADAKLVVSLIGEILSPK